MSGRVLASTRSQIMQAPSELAITHSLSMPLILMHLAEALCFLMDSRSLRVLGRISHTLANAHTHAPGRRIDSHRLNSTHEATDTALPASRDCWSPGYRAISIHALFHPQPVLLSLYLNCYHLQQETKDTHAVRSQTSAHLAPQQRCILFLSHRPVVKS